MLAGSYEVKLIKNNKVKVPMKLRESLGDKVVLGINTVDNCIVIISLEQYKEFKEKGNNSIKQSLFLKNVYIIDEQGMLEIEPELLRLSGIKESCVFLGMHTYVELWEKDIFKNYFDSIDMEKIEASLKKIGF